MDRQIISFDMFGDGRMWEQDNCEHEHHMHHHDHKDRDCDRDRKDCNCDCPKNKWGNTAVDNLPLAMVYGPMQKFTGACDPDEGLQVGTIFRELNKPFCGKRVR